MGKDDFIVKYKISQKLIFWSLIYFLHNGKLILISQTFKTIILNFNLLNCKSSIFDEAKVGELQKTFEVIPHIKDIEYFWDLSSSYQLVNKYLPSLPAKTKYFLYMNNLDLKTDPEFDEKLRMLNWIDKRIYSIDCNTLQQLNIFNKTRWTI